jgi:hypothetical protein
MTFKTKPRHLYPIVKDIKWAIPFLYERVYKIDYDIPVKHWTAYPFTESLDRAIKPVVIVTIYGGYSTNIYRWTRYGIDAIVEERNVDLLNHFFKQDVLSHI